MRNIYLFSLLCWLYLLPLGLFAQDVRQVKGRVIDAATGERIIGASIRVKGSKGGALSDANGNFSLQVARGSVLLVSYIGYRSQEMIVNDIGDITVKLEIASNDLQQVVVVGYGTQKKRDLTGSISVVKGEDIAKQPNTNPVASLQGRVAGLTNCL